MTHTDIEEQQIVDRYVMGKLPEAEAARFEEHYLSCPECLDRIDLAESMQRGFRRAAGQDLARLAAGRQLALVAWLARLGRSRQAAVLLMGLFVALVLPGGFALRQLGERDRELTAARAALEQERERSAAGSRGTAEAEKLRAELDESRRQLDRERQAGARAAQQLAQSAQQLAAVQRPQSNVPILFLNAERGAGGDAGEPSHRLRLPSTPGWIVLALEVDPPHAPSYRAVLRDSRGKELWRGEGLEINQLEALSVSLPSGLLAPGDYTLVVEGIERGARPVAAGRFNFRALPPA
jgi:putative zinc finger protein